MRFSALSILAAASAIVSAQTAYYPFTDNGACVAKCLLDVGKSMYTDFTDDPTSPYFLASLAYAHDKGTPKYTTYMTDTGMCIAGCPQAEMDLYNSQYQAKADWYAAHTNATATPTTQSNVTATATATEANSHGHGGAATTTAAADATSGAAGFAAGSGAILYTAAAVLGAFALF